MRLHLFCGAIALTAAAAEAEIVMPDIFSDNMVLQQQSDARIWGWCTPGASVVVNPGWSEVSYSATAGKDGRWDVAVATPEASYPPGRSLSAEMHLKSDLRMCSWVRCGCVPVSPTWKCL